MNQQNPSILRSTKASRHGPAQPGPAHPQRLESRAGALKVAEIVLEPGLSLCDAIARPLASLGIRSAGVVLSGVTLGPMQFVMPSHSQAPDHVAYYSETYRPQGEVTLDLATATFGFRDGAPFMHCHALWRDAEGRQCGGHILPLDSLIARRCTVSVFGTPDADMLSRADAETNFTLFGPEPADGGGSGGLIVARIRPDEDLVTGIEAICARHGATHATIRSGVGSIVGALFEDGTVVSEIPTELVVVDGRVSPDEGGQPRCDLEIALIDAAGNIHRGKPVRGQNPVLICCELFIDTESPAAVS